MKRMAGVFFTLLLAMILMTSMALSEETPKRFLFQQAFSFGMTAEEVEAQGELTYLYENSPFHTYGTRYAVDELHSYVEYTSENMAIDFLFLQEGDASSLQEIIVALMNVNVAVQSMRSLQEDEHAQNAAAEDAHPAVQSDLDYDAIEQVLSRKYGDAKEASLSASLLMKWAMGNNQDAALSRIVRRVLAEDENILVIDHLLFGYLHQENSINVVIYRCMTSEEWAAFQYEQDLKSIDDFLDKML